MEEQQDLAPLATPPEVAVAAIDDIQAAFKQAIARAGPAVVSVYTTKTITATPFGGPMRGDPFFDFFNFSLPDGPPREFQQQGLGSGFVIDDNGHILTNHHVVGGADGVKVKLADDREFDATVIGSDPQTDLAVLKIEATDLHPVEFGSSDSLEVGDWVLAIGDPFGLPQTISAGIVSAKGRANMGIVDYEDFIQTDAAVNPGNSGGPLVDLNGRVVGVNTAIASRSGGNNGIAFAIPASLAKQVIDQLIDHGAVVRGQLGVLVSELSPDMAASFGFEDQAGILVQDVVPDGPAERAGVRSGDIITSINDQATSTVTAFRRDIADQQPGSTMRLKVWRDGKTETLEAKLAAAQAQAQVGDAPATATREPPKLGVALQDITPKLQQALRLGQSSGVLITHVQPGSPASKAGIRPGDILEQVGDEQVQDAARAVRLLTDADLEQGVRLRVSRDGQGRFVLVKVKPGAKSAGRP
ncbi:HtrA protease/chaperone protein [Enhygromyxa salina]|uniref:HtrA protease/chaperone protein n=1 Tax=Enhygromyxa salina TaxID=215803 RepID=A0A0C2CRI8_9BACT|nr:HtrA protease/chaperone protein [Enhygromyxa salina]